MNAAPAWIRWILTSSLSAVVAVPLGYAVAAGVNAGVSALFLLPFIGIIPLIVGAAGGAAAGGIACRAQKWALTSFFKDHAGWVQRGAITWGIVGAAAGDAAYVPVARGDVSLIIPLAVSSSLLTGIVQWIALYRRLPHASWWIGAGAAGMMVGSIAGGTLLGGLTDRGAAETLRNALTARESLTEVGGVKLTNLDGNLLFFVTKRDVYQNARWELWTSDGTPDGTLMVKPVYTGWNQPSITPVTTSNGRFFLGANGVEDKADAQSWKNRGGLWRTDGTAAGTIRVETLAGEMLDINGTLFFTLWRDDTCTLYQSDGTDANTRLIKQIDEGCAFRVIGQAQRLFFATATEKPDVIDCTLWASEGAERDTKPIRHFQTKPGSSCIRDMIMLDDKLIMLLTERGTPNNELWMSDGAINSTVFVKQIPGIFIENLNFRILFVSGGRVFFSSGAGTGTPCQLWVSDGTSDGTYPLKSACLDQYSMVAVGDIMLFVVDTPSGGWELWKSDGTPAGTQLVRDRFTFGKDSWRPQLLLVDGKTLFLAIHDDRGCAVWRSDGTAEGTVELQRGCPDELVSVNGTLFFVTPRNKREIELWKNGGTGTGATLIKVIP